MEERPQRGQWQTHWEYPGLWSIGPLPTRSLWQQMPEFDAMEITELEGIVIQARALSFMESQGVGGGVQHPQGSSGIAPKSRRQAAVAEGDEGPLCLTDFHISISCWASWTHHRTSHIERDLRLKQWSILRHRWETVLGWILPEAELELKI